MIILNNKIYGISKDFEFLINTIGVPRYNSLGKEISESTYNKYNVFCYDEPYNLISNSKQRFKTVNGGKTKYKNDFGEFNILGYSYSGALVYNFYFPVDYIPETTPNNWEYIVTEGARKSWDLINFKNLNNMNYMKNTSMLFDYIDFENNSTNPYNQVDYNLTPNKVGLDKVVMNTYSTFKTKGILTARRKNPNGNITYSIFSTAPMAINANIKSKLNCNENIVLNEREQEIDINIDFGATINGLNDYATKNNIKEVVSELYINNKKVSVISNVKTDNINRIYTFKINRKEYEKASKYPILLKVKSYFYTEFDVDGIFKNEITKTVNLTVKELKKEIVRSYDLNILEKDSKGKYILTPLIQNIATKNVSSGIIEKGKYITLTINTDSRLDTSDLNIYINNNKVEKEILKSNNKITILKIYIDDMSSNTIASWKYLRDRQGSYFDIDFNNIGDRINKPNKLTLKTNEKEYIKYFDTIDYFGYNTNYNKNSFVRANEYIYLDNIYE